MILKMFSPHCAIRNQKAIPPLQYFCHLHTQRETTDISEQMQQQDFELPGFLFINDRLEATKVKDRHGFFPRTMR